MGEAKKQPLLEALNCHPESGSRRIEGPRNVTVIFRTGILRLRCAPLRMTSALTIA
jgi:hypothetical protein